ncbi:MAG: 2TM domain-containing protein [Rhodothermales bacterium]
MSTPMMTRREAKGLLASFKDRKHEEARFYFHLAAFFAVNVFAITLNITEAQNAGPIFLPPLVLTGSLLFAHARRVFGWKGKKTKAWEERMIYELMNGEEMPEEQFTLIQAIEKLKSPAGAGPVKETEASQQLQKRIEHLEAIIASEQWDQSSMDELRVDPHETRQRTAVRPS